MEIVDTSPDDHLASIEDPTIAETMRSIDALIVDAMPDRRRVLWQGVFWGGTEQTIIGYGHITQSRPRGPDVDWFLVGLARQKRNYSIYLNAVLDGSYLAHHYAERLGRAKLGAASIGFTDVAAIDTAVLTELLVRAHEITPPDPAT